MLITTIEKIVSFLKPLVPFDTPPVFADDKERKVTEALCSMYSGDQCCDPGLNPYAGGLLKRYQTIAPQPILNEGSLLFRFGVSLYLVGCSRDTCFAQSITKQNVIGDVVEKIIANAMTFSLTRCYLPPGQLAKGVDVNAKDEDGETLLMSAVVMQEEEKAKLLIARGADVNAKSKIGETALMLSANYGYKEATKIMIANGADVNAKDEDGKTALMRTAVNDYRGEYVNVYTDEYKDGNPVRYVNSVRDAAVYAKHKEIAELLIASGANVNEKDNNGGTALMNAVFWGYPEVARLLIANGADVNARYKVDEFRFRSGDTALSLAVERGNNEIAELLITNGAK